MAVPVDFHPDSCIIRQPTTIDKARCLANEGQCHASKLHGSEASFTSSSVVILSDPADLTSACISHSLPLFAICKFATQQLYLIGPASEQVRMAHPGTAHKYSEKFIAFEHAGAHSSNDNDAPNTLLWIGGLGDGLLTVQ